RQQVLVAAHALPQHSKALARVPHVGMGHRREEGLGGAEAVERHPGARHGCGVHQRRQQRHAVAARDQLAGDAQERVQVAGGADGDDKDVRTRSRKVQSSDLPTRSNRGCQWSRMSADTTMWLALPISSSRGTTPMWRESALLSRLSPSMKK